MTSPVDGPILALDSSTRGGSVAVGVGLHLMAERVLEASSGASSLLMPAVDEAVRAAGLSPRDLAAVAVSGGPGSFTGLRIAAATAKAIVRALDIPLFAYSGLLAAAATLRESGCPVCALFDARNREVFAGCWRFGVDSVDELMAPCILGIDEVIERMQPTSAFARPPMFTGDGAALHADALWRRFGPDAIAGSDGSPAKGLLWLAAMAAETGRVADPAAWEPAYLRASGAERIAAARGA